MGGLQATQKFARLYLVPGVFHCVNGYGPDTFDLFTPLYNWVEHGVAAQQIIATKKNGAQTVRTRPVYPYPMQTRYTGSGDVNDAANYTGVMPSPLPDDSYPWLGGPFQSGYQQWCHWEGTKLVCDRAGQD
jgi:feruloyl esterase